MTSEEIKIMIECNFELLNQIHAAHHRIEKLKMTECCNQRDRWTEREDRLLKSIMAYFEKPNYAQIAKFIASKTSKQVYFRLRYLSQQKCKAALE
ncbi:SANT/Myb_domain [Hexamita inflata]|uniref:SANT/Myb domain n=1 Tax=Hexamita inflata TaxID=28002 RepID=A0AA86P646_9EUKA|nr:SANT/Myb domain [Hexamita inflata]CAI9931416.1 SANT/Myb domain [Hexamita inflata]CAI9973143.1 SANT/Myb domain [Hexamita inflata]CAI9973148.1 SANT/Myb domain [Hexamita inflata]